MSDSAADPRLVGPRFSQEKQSERLNSSTSVSDLSEAISDMSLSTSPGSDIPTQQPKGFMTMSTSPTGVHDTTSQEPQQPHPRKRLVVRQLSSNPYLTSSEMSPPEEHPLITGSHSYAAGDSRLYANEGDFTDQDSSGYYSRTLPQRANSYPLTSDCVDESDEEEGDDQDEDDSSYDEAQTRRSPSDILLDTSHDSITGSKPQHPNNQISKDNSQNQPFSTTLRPGVSPTLMTGATEALQARHQHHLHNHNHLHEPQRGHNDPSYPHNHTHHHNHSHQQPQQPQQHFVNSLNNSGTNSAPPFNAFGNKINGYKWNSNQNELYSAASACHRMSDISPEHQHGGVIPSQPKSREINSWGHFYKTSDSHYKYRRSHYSSDSDEEVTSSSTKTHSKQSSSNRLSACKAHAPTCKCNNKSPMQSPCARRTNISSTQPLNSAEKKGGSQSGMKPMEFKERFQLMKRWFSECNDEQKNIVLKGLLSLCELPQLHLLSVHMSKELHHGCPSNCEDIITWLPTDLATKVMSYLDPVSLCHAAQVCRVWRQLAEDQSLWRRFCCQTKWRLSKAAEHKQVISHMCPEGSIQWKNVFAERFRLRNNWLKGRCTVRTFEGHLQGISCVQFDDSRIVSGSSDKTIKVWNMRTNAPWSVQTLMGHHGTVRCLHLEGNRLVSGSCDTTIKVWDLSTQESWSSIACKVTMTGHSDTVRCLQADDDKVISGSYDKTLKIWDLKSGELRRTLRGHQASVLCVHFSETKIVSGSADRTIKVWNYEGKCMMTLRGHQDAVTCLMFDSTRIVSGSLDHNLKFWDIHTGECLNTIDWKKAEGHTDVVRCLQADSWRVVSAADDKTIKVWNLATGERLVTLRNHTDGVTCLQFNDFIIVSGSYDKSVKLWDFSCC